jgi:hypothetical protein
LSVIPATRKAEIRDHRLRPSWGKMGDPIQKISKITKAKEGCGMVVQEIEHLPHQFETLSSNFSTTKKIFFSLILKA